MTAEPIPARRKYTVEEYLDLEHTSQVRHEFFNGEIIDMSGGTLNHSAICANLIGELHARLKGTPCRVFESNLRVRIQIGTLYTYPDLTIICGQPEHDPLDKNKTTIINPRVIFEVLSPSTERWDRTDKFRRYRNLPSLEEYVLVSQEYPMVDAYHKDSADNWSLKPHDSMDKTMLLRSLQLQVPLVDIYRGVEFPPVIE